MKVLFLKHVINVWKPGEIKEVKPGFAQNMLFPKGLAVELTPEEEKRRNDKLKREENRRMWLIENRHNIADSLNWQKLTFTLKADNSWKVFGWIWEKDIIAELKKKFKVELSKSHINMPDWHLKKVWEHVVYIKLGKDSMAKMMIEVKSENVK